MWARSSKSCVLIGYTSGQNELILAARDFPNDPTRKRFLSAHIINPLLTKLASLTSPQSINIYIQTKQLFNNAYIVTPNRGRHLTSLCS